MTNYKFMLLGGKVCFGSMDVWPPPQRPDDCTSIADWLKEKGISNEPRKPAPARVEDEVDEHDFDLATYLSEDLLHDYWDWMSIFGPDDEYSQEYREELEKRNIT